MKKKYYANYSSKKVSYDMIDKEWIRPSNKDKAIGAFLGKARPKEKKPVDVTVYEVLKDELIPVMTATAKIVDDYRMVITHRKPIDVVKESVNDYSKKINLIIENTYFELLDDSYYMEHVDDILLLLEENLNRKVSMLMDNSSMKFYLENTITEVYQLILEKLSTKSRDNLDDSEFGIPSIRKYPMPDKKHVESAIRMFNHVEKKYEKELANNIIKKMKQYDLLHDIEVGKENRLKKYINLAYKNYKESYDIHPFSEFTVGAMLPSMGNSKGWGTVLAKKPISKVVSDVSDEIERDKDDIPDIADGILYSGNKLDIMKHSSKQYVYEHVSLFQQEMDRIYKAIGSSIESFHYGLLNKSAILNCKSASIDQALRGLMELGYQTKKIEGNVYALYLVIGEISFTVLVDYTNNSLSFTYDNYSNTSDMI